jgi:ABC-type lipoprotein export system ATPase subunit
MMDVWKIYSMNGTSVEVLRSVELAMEIGEFIALVRSSDCASLQ